MRTTIDIPDELFRRVKSQAALRGRKLKDLIEEGLQRVLEQPEDASGTSSAHQAKPSADDLLRDLRGSIKGGPSDLSTNPRYLDKFGE